MTAKSSRAAVRTLLRSLVGTVVLVALYYRLPLDHGFSNRTSLELFVLLLGVGVVLAVQIRAISDSPHPRVRAVGALATSIPLFLLIYAATYYALGHSDPRSFSEGLDRTDALYFTVTVFSTVGFGDIVPTTDTTRVVAMTQMIGDLVLIGLVGRVVLGAVNQNLQARGRSEQPPM